MCDSAMGVCPGEPPPCLDTVSLVTLLPRPLPRSREDFQDQGWAELTCHRGCPPNAPVGHRHDRALCSLPPQTKPERAMIQELGRLGQDSLRGTERHRLHGSHRPQIRLLGSLCFQLWGQPPRRGTTKFPQRSHVHPHTEKCLYRHTHVHTHVHRNTKWC